MEEKKILNRDEVMQRVAARLKETQAAQNGIELPKGTALEDEMIKAETPVEPEPSPLPEHNSEGIIPEEKKKGRGRPPGKIGKYKTKKVTKQKEPNGTTTETVTESEHDSPPVEPVDFLTPVINTVLIPTVAYLAKKDAELIKITPEQSKEAAKLMPPDAPMLKPSWPAFLGMLTLAIASNVMAAPKKSAESSDMADIKKALAKSLEIEKMRLEIIEMSKKMSDIQSKMSVVRDEPVTREKDRWTEDIVITGT